MILITEDNTSLTQDESKTITLISPGDDENDDKKEWDDEDDENFEDRADDRDDLHEIQLDNNILDKEDDDHLPDDRDN